MLKGGGGRGRKLSWEGGGTGSVQGCFPSIDLCTLNSNPN